MDLKIEIRKLFALHEATVRYEHAVREIDNTDWVDFTPSRFIYAFFTFNSIYSYDWKSSFREREAIKWARNSAGHVPPEEDQFKAYLKFVNEILTPDAPKSVSSELRKWTKSFDVVNPVDELKTVELENADNKLKTLAQQLPNQFKSLLEPKSNARDFYSPACWVLQFIYRVRCNLFHGSKTQVQLLDPAQQGRLVIYTTTLIAMNAMLFRIVESKADEIGWQEVEVILTPDQAASDGRESATRA